MDRVEERARQIVGQFKSLFRPEASRTRLDAIDEAELALTAIRRIQYGSKY